MAVALGPHRKRTFAYHRKAKGLRLVPSRNSCDKDKSLLAKITDTQNEPPEVWCRRRWCVLGHDGVVGSLAGATGGDRRWNALFWSPLSLWICLSSAKNRVLRLSTGRNPGWSADPSNLDLWGSCYGEILNRAIPATRKTSSDLPAATAAKMLLWAAPKKDGCKQSRMSRFGARTGVGFSCGP